MDENGDNKTNSRVNKFREYSLALAESFDAWRVTPRLLVGAYCFLVGDIIHKFLIFPTINKVTCDSAVLQVMLDHKIDLGTATAVACRITDTVGPPTTYTVIVSAVLGVAAAVFAVYTNTGKDWSKAITPWKWGQSNSENNIKEQLHQDEDK